MSNFLLDRLIRKALTLQKKVAYDRSKSGSIPIETYKNRCLGFIERVNELKYFKKADIEHAKKRLFNVYFFLQNVKCSERSKAHPTEISVELVGHQLDDAVSHSFRRSGGLGFSSISGVTLTEQQGEPINHYYKKVKVKQWYRPKEYKLQSERKQSLQEWRLEMIEQKKEVMWRLSVKTVKAKKPRN